MLRYVLFCGVEITLGGNKSQIFRFNFQYYFYGVSSASSCYRVFLSIFSMYLLGLGWLTGAYYSATYLVDSEKGLRCEKLQMFDGM